MRAISRWRAALALAVVVSATHPTLAQNDFRRGDVDIDGEVNFVTDAAYLAAALFGGGPGLECADAADFGDDGLVDITDVALLLTIGFFGGSVPPPFPGCGPDPTIDSLDCANYDCDAIVEGPAPDPGLGLAISADPGVAGDSTLADFDLTILDRQLSAWSLGVCNDPGVAEIISVSPGDDLIALEPDFDATNVYPGEGWTAAALLRYDGSISLGTGTYQLYRAQYDYLTDGTVDPQLCDTLPVPVTFVIDEVVGGVVEDVIGVLPVLIPGGGSGPRFRRGDANGDGIIDIGDPIWLIAYVFQDGAAPPCARAGDANSDQVLNVADAIWLISFFFVDGLPPGAPYPACGTQESALSCAAYPACP